MITIRIIPPGRYKSINYLAALSLPLMFSGFLKGKASDLLLFSRISLGVDQAVSLGSEIAWLAPASPPASRDAVRLKNGSNLPLVGFCPQESPYYGWV